MHRDTVLKMAKAKVEREFSSVTEAALVMGVDRATLSIFLNNHERVKDKEVPPYILNYLGLEKQRTTTYHKKQGK